MARKDAIIQTDIDNGRLTITVAGFAPIVVDPTDYPTELVEYAALHGFKQRYVDAAALGAGSTPAEKHAEIERLVTYHRATGEWKRTGDGDGSAGGDGLLVRAIMEYHEMERDAARTAVGTLDKKTQAQLRASAELKPIIDRLRVAKAPKASVDVSAILAGIGR